MTKERDNVFELNAAIAEAKPVGPADLPEEPPPEDPQEGQSERRSRRRDGTRALPEDCPVVPLGVTGMVCHYLDASQQIISLKESQHGQAGMAKLFAGQITYLWNHWPRLNATGEKVGWRAEQIRDDLMDCCARRGVYDIFGRVRMAGSWLGEQGELVMHAGDGICRSKPPRDPDQADTGAAPADAARPTFDKPGQAGRFVYPADAPQPRPLEEKPDGQPAEELLDLLRCWNWRRGETDAYLLLGWIGAAVMGGALKWRPLAWITGDKFTGKSTVQELLTYLLDDSLIPVADTTAAGIWQTLGLRSLPVAIDELEADADNRKSEAVIKLARLAASGSLMLRGGADHQGSQFMARSCFLMSSILVPPLKSQDRSRMAILELDKLAKDAPKPVIKPEAWRQVGRALRRRLLDGWPRWGETLALYQEALLKQGHNARSADVFGTLLAAADLLLYSQVPSGDELDNWGEKLAAGELAELADDRADHDRCLDHLLTFAPDIYRSGKRVPLALYIEEAAERPSPDSSATPDPAQANRDLGSYGLKVVKATGKDGAGQDVTRLHLAVAVSHQKLSGEVFAGTHWTGGVWSQALGRVPGAARSKSNLRIGGLPTRCWLLPIDAVLSRDG